MILIIAILATSFLLCFSIVWIFSSLLGSAISKALVDAIKNAIKKNE